MGSKVCSKCKIEKDLSEFYFHQSKGREGKPLPICKDCAKKHNGTPPEKLNANLRQWRAKNHERYYLADKIWRNKNPDKVSVTRKKYRTKKKATDPLYRCRSAIRSLVISAIKGKGYKKKTKTCQIIGCSFTELHAYIENQFKPGMTWLNHGEWHLDHKVPMALAKTEEEAIALNHYTNLQPLWAKDNLAKFDKIDLELVNNSTEAIKEIALTTITTQEK